jgi:hypothetical protein
LTAYTTPISGDVIPIVDTTNTTTKKIDIINLGANGFTANATPTANNIPVLDANALLPQAAIPTQFLVDQILT